MLLPVTHSPSHPPIYPPALTHRGLFHSFVVRPFVRSVRLLRTVAPLGGDETVSVQARLEAVEEEETVRMHLAALKREEAALQASPVSSGVSG